MLGPGNGAVTTDSMVDFTSTAEYEHEGNISPRVEHEGEKAQSLKGADNTGASPSVPSLSFHDSGLQIGQGAVFLFQKDRTLGGSV